MTSETESLKRRIKELENKLAVKKEDTEKFLKFLVANLSHEIRTPLNSILGFSNLLTTEKHSEKKKQEFVEMINTSSDRLVNIVDNLLELAQIQNNQLFIEHDSCNLLTLLDDMYHVYNLKKFLADKHEIALLYSCQLPKEELTVYCDEIRLKQLLGHLLDNAFKFTKKGIVEFGCIRDQHIIQFFVRDSGIGISENSPNVFDPFVKLNDAELMETCGVGIGLSVCEGIVHAMKGKIWYETNIFNGTTFFVNLPFVKYLKKKEGNLNNKSIDDPFFS